jgi:predicted nucleic acid-binding protein
VTPPLVDSDVVIDLLRKRDEAVACVRQEVLRGPVYGSVLTRAEVLAGMLPGEETATEEHLEIIRWLPVDSRIADRAGEFSRRHRAAHSGIDLTDYVIAATADVAGLRLLTRNVKHYPMFRRLRPAY